MRDLSAGIDHVVNYEMPLNAEVRAAACLGIFKQRQNEES